MEKLTVRRRPPATAVARAFGTFGELLQGRLAENQLDFLVTLPIARWTTATFEHDPAAAEVTVFPPHKHKAHRLAGDILAAFGVAGGGTLTIDSRMPVGKGFASSSADLVATSRAMAAALGVEMTAGAIEDLLRPIEPTDGVMHPGVVAFYHREVRLRERLGSLPPLTIVAVDEGGTVDTVAFNRVRKPFSRADEREYSRLLATLREAFRDRDLATIGAVATASAVMNQQLRPKRTLDTVLRLCEEVGGLGVVVAHSGTTLGILLADEDAAFADKLARAQSSCRDIAGAGTIYRSLVHLPV